MFRIMCHRSGNSVFGAASAYAKHDGVILEFKTRLAAAFVARQYTESLSTPNVKYEVVEVPDEQS